MQDSSFGFRALKAKAKAMAVEEMSREEFFKLADVIDAIGHGVDVELNTTAAVITVKHGKDIVSIQYEYTPISV